MNHASEILRIAKARNALRRGSFSLSSGGVSDFYFDGRILTLDPAGAYHVAQAILPMVRGHGAVAVAGPETGAVPMVTAIALTSHIDKGVPIQGLVVRKPHQSGTDRGLLEGRVVPGSKVAIVDDTCSTGKGILHAIAVIEQAGCSVSNVVSILERIGGGEEIRRQGYEYHSLLKVSTEGGVYAVEC